MKSEEHPWSDQARAHSALVSGYSVRGAIRRFAPIAPIALRVPTSRALSQVN